MRITVQMTQGAPMTIDLTPFCGEDCRYSLSAPWVKDGWKYATDGKICVRVPCHEPNTRHADRTFPDAEDLFRRYFTRKLCTAALPVWDGRTRKCSEPCGCVEHDDQPWPDCARCDGTGKIQWTQYSTVKAAGNMFFFGGYIEKIQALPNAHCFVHVKAAPNLWGVGLSFIFHGGGEGMLMPTEIEIVIPAEEAEAAK